MTGKRIIALVSLLLLAGALVPAIPSAAKSTRTPVDLWEIVCLIDPGFEWFDEEGVFHFRGRLTQSTFYDPDSFEIIGGMSGVQNANLEPPMFTGTLFGIWSAVYLPMSATGTFDGSWNGKLAADFLFLGKAVGQGTGELRGLKMKLSLVGDPADPPPLGLFMATGFPPCDPSEIVGILHNSGFILNPHGD